jgi:hypothetical protein
MSLLLRSMTTDMPREDEVLFVKYDLHAVLQAHEAEMSSKIDAIDQNELLGIDIDQLCDYYEAEYRVDVPRLDESAVSVDQREIQIDVSQGPGRVIRDRGRPLLRHRDRSHVLRPVRGRREPLLLRRLATELPAPSGHCWIERTARRGSSTQLGCRGSPR